MALVRMREKRGCPASSSPSSELTQPKKELKQKQTQERKGRGRGERGITEEAQRAARGRVQRERQEGWVGLAASLSEKPGHQGGQERHVVVPRLPVVQPLSASQPTCL